MLYQYPIIKHHKSYRLNRHLIYFFSKLRKVEAKSVFEIESYFHGEFIEFLGSKKQETLRRLFLDFFNAYKKLTEDEKKLLISSFSNSQKIGTILENPLISCLPYQLLQIPKSIRKPSKALFEYLYSTTLKSFGKLREHYELFFSALPNNICPFCGIELLNKPSIARQDYDHLLLQSSYVFVTVNMDNLVPTGTECNRINKHSIDAIYFEGQRSVFNSPYTGHYPITISLEGSLPPQTIDGIGTWEISINPDNKYTKQWAYVYNIKKRYSDNVLDKFYKNWMKEFRDYLILQELIPIDKERLLKELAIQAKLYISNPTTSVANIVKGAFFEFVATNEDLKYQNSILNYFNG